jgi:hypothetical protein
MKKNGVDHIINMKATSNQPPNLKESHFSSMHFVEKSSNFVGKNCDFVGKSCDFVENRCDLSFNDIVSNRQDRYSMG